jgi:hypothetical protein
MVDQIFGNNVKIISVLLLTNVFSDSDKSSFLIHVYLTRVEAGSNTSTVNLRVVRGDEMGLKKAVP